MSGKRRLQPGASSSKRKKSIKVADGEDEKDAIISIHSSSSVDDVFEIPNEEEDKHFPIKKGRHSDADPIKVISVTRKKKKASNDSEPEVQVIGSSSRSQIQTKTRGRESFGSDILFIREERCGNAGTSTVASSSASIPIGNDSSSSSRVDNRSSAAYHDLDAAMARELQDEEYHQLQGPPSIAFQINAMRELGMDEAMIRSLLQE